MKYRTLCALLLLSLATVAHASDWVRVRVLPQGDHYYYDRSMLIISKDEISYWKKAVFRVPRRLENGLAAVGMFREQINCSKQTLKLISYLFYSPAGHVIEYVANAKGKASAIIPDTLGDAFAKAMCPLVRRRQEALRRKRAEAKRAAAAQAEAERAARQAAAQKACAEPPSCPQPPTPGTAPINDTPAAHGANAGQGAQTPSCAKPQQGPAAEKDLSAPAGCHTMDSSTKAKPQ